MPGRLPSPSRAKNSAPGAWITKCPLMHKRGITKVALMHSMPRWSLPFWAEGHH